MLTARPESAELKRLKALYRELDGDDRALLVAFAELLAARRATALDERAPEPVPEPLSRPRPAGESVIAAIRRLSETYPMLDRGAMLHETSAMMSAHVLQGHGKAQTIDALEALFARHYEEFRAHLPGTEQDPNRSV